jgi:hypothetical protein
MYDEGEQEKIEIRERKGRRNDGEYRQSIDKEKEQREIVR